MSPSIVSSQSDPPTEHVNRLEGLTILRFAHAYESGGGVELHLQDLNRGLSLRNSLTTVLIHLTHQAAPAGESAELIGESKLIKVPLRASEKADQPRPTAGFFRKWMRYALNILFFSFAVNSLAAGTLLRWRRVPTRPGEALGAGVTATEMIKRHNVDLVVLHTNGGADASEVIVAARDAGIPIAVIHHFSNDRLGNVSVRQQLADIDAIAGASAVGLPFYVRRKFTNLSDAVDLEFYRVANAMPVPVAFSTPVLFAPGRLTPEKGQMDALRIAVELHRRGIKFTLAFAGRVDDIAYEEALREKARMEGLSDFVHFAGELTLSQYRDWFKAAYLMLMPTHHHEGMPRTLIESQAMMVPPIVYDIGGTPDGVRHSQTGFLVRLGDYRTMANHAAELLENPALRQRMAVNGRAFVESEFNMHAFLARHENFYLDTLSRFAAGKHRTSQH